MLKAVEQLVRNQRTSVGNHRRIDLQKEEHEVARYIYHDTVICEVDYSVQTFRCSYGGWHTPSTARAINSYRSFFNDVCYMEVFDDLTELLDYISGLGYTAKKQVAIGSLSRPHTIICINKYITKEGYNTDLAIKHREVAGGFFCKEKITLTNRYATRLMDDVKKVVEECFDWKYSL